MKGVVRMVFWIEEEELYTMQQAIPIKKTVVRCIISDLSTVLM